MSAKTQKHDINHSWDIVKFFKHKLKISFLKKYNFEKKRNSKFFDLNIC